MEKVGKRKVVINGRFLTQNVSGVQRYSIEVVRALDSIVNTDECEYQLVYPKRGVLITKMSLQNITLVPMGSFTGHLWEQLDLPRQYCDVLLCLGNTAPVLSLFFGKVVSVVHDLSYKYYPEAYSWLFRTGYEVLVPLVMRRSKDIFTVSDSEKRAIVGYYPKMKDRLKVSPCGGFSIELKRYILEKVKSVKRRKVLTYVGTLNPRKNLIGFLKAFELVQEELSDYEVYVIGGGDRVFADGNLKAFSANPRISFFGQINDPKIIIDKLLESYALVFPSFYEASPIPPIEAMNCGCVVVASDIPSLQERCGEAAVYCQPDDVHSIAVAIRKVAREQSIYDNLRLLSEANAEKFTWEKTAHRIFDAITT